MGVAPRSFSRAARAGESCSPITGTEVPERLAMVVQRLMRTQGSSVWSQQQQLVATEGVGGDEFAYSVAASTSGTTALIGIPGANGAQGAAYIFTRASGTWRLQSELTAADGTASDHFGWSVALSGGGNTAVVGAAAEAFAGSYREGAAYVDTRSSTQS